MVSHSRMKRPVAQRPYGRHERQSGEKATLLLLADEVILEMLAFASVNDILALRITCQDIVPACNTALGLRLKRLYILPTPKHLKDAVEICNHWLFQQNIEEVVLLGKIPWTEINETYRDYRNAWLKETDHGLGLGPEVETLPQWENRFRAWPAAFPSVVPHSERSDDEQQLYWKATSPKKTKKVQKPQSDADDIFTRFRQAYEPLTRALSKLPKLNAIAFAQAVSGAGLNQPLSSSIDGLVESISSETADLQPPGSKINRKTGRLTRRFADAEVLYGLLFDSRLSFTAVRQEVELPFVENMVELFGIREPSAEFPPISWDLSSPRMRSLSYFTSLDLYIDCGWDEHSRKELYSVLLHRSRNTLERLQIVLGRNKHIDRPEPEGTVDYVLGTLPLYPRLTSLEMEFVYRDFPMHPEAQQEENMTRLRPQRPHTEDYDMAAFIEVHLRTLTHVRFKNVIFAQHNGFEVKAAPQLTWECLDALRKCTVLKHAEWIVNCFGHESKCNARNSEELGSCRNGCGLYYWLPGGTIGPPPVHQVVEAFDALACRLDVSLNKETKAWDFGKSVMRDIELQKMQALEDAIAAVDLAS